MRVELTSYDIEGPAPKTRHHFAAFCYLSSWYIHQTILPQVHRARVLRSATDNDTGSTNPNLRERHREGQQEYQASLINAERDQAYIGATGLGGSALQSGRRASGSHEAPDPRAIAVMGQGIPPQSPRRRHTSVNSQYFAPRDSSVRHSRSRSADKLS